jgi:osmoprotectant transport system permease protein
MEVLGEFFDFITTAENWWGNRGIITRTIDHIRLSFFSVAVATVLAMPLALVLGHFRRGGVVAVWVVNIGRAVPSFAILALALPISIQYGFGLGFWPTSVALVLLAVPPIFTNSYTGIRGVDAGTVGAAEGMGMTSRQVITRVEVPNALPLILTGLRVSSVQVVATATLGALVGFGGLGAFIIEGFAQQDDGKLLTGAVLVGLLSLATDAGFSLLQRLLTPWSRTVSPSEADPVDRHAVPIG